MHRDWRKNDSTETAWFPQPVIQPTSPNRSTWFAVEEREGWRAERVSRGDRVPLQLLTVESKRGGQQDSRGRIYATGAYSAMFLRLLFFFSSFLSFFSFSSFLDWSGWRTPENRNRRKARGEKKEKKTVPHGCRGCRAVNGSPRQIGREQAARLAQISRHARNPEPICNAIYIYIETLRRTFVRDRERGQLSAGKLNKLSMKNATERSSE